MKTKSSSLGLVGCLWVVKLIPSFGCGGFFCEPQQPVLQAGENIAFGVRQVGADKVEIEMVVQINYEGPAEAFAWVLPVPTNPTSIDIGSDLLFQGLFESTRPNFVFQIDNEQSITCSAEQLQPDFSECAVADSAGSPTLGSPEMEEDLDDGVDILDEGTVGPFGFTTLEASSREEAGKVFEWLLENGYDQPPEAEPLVTDYAAMGMKFVALQLLKESDVGEIRPIILKYTVDGDLATKPVACIPLQLTSIAATPEMPIQVYTLAPSRGVPKNFAHANLDLRNMDWLNCQNLFFGINAQDCYLNDYRELFQATAWEIEEHAFVTEYAGPASIAADSIPATSNNLDLDRLKGLTDPLEFLLYLSESEVPGIPLVHTIIEEYIPNKISPNQFTPFPCFTRQNTYTPGRLVSQMSDCIEYVEFQGRECDPVALATELNDQVFKPAEDAQEWLKSYGYLTRLYAQLDPKNMTKDPLFAFNEETEDVSLETVAIGVPVCDDGGPIGMEISLENPPSGLEGSVFLSASFGCDGTWTRPQSFLVNRVPAVSLTGYNYTGLTSTTIFPDPQTGRFSNADVSRLVEALDATDSPAPTNPTPSPTIASGANSGFVELLTLTAPLVSLLIITFAM